MKALYRYFRWHGMRWAIWDIRFGCIAWGVIIFGWMIEREPNGWSIVAVIACYGVYAVTNALKGLHPVIVTQIKPGRLEINSGQFVLNTDDLDRAVERLVAKRAPHVEVPNK